MKQVEKITQSALALTAQQKEAFAELTKVVAKCKDLGVAIVKTADGIYAVNDEHIYDVNPVYDDWTVEPVNMKHQAQVPCLRCYDESELGATHIKVAFDNETASAIYEAYNNKNAA